MVAPAVDGIDLFKIANRSISGWIPSLKTGVAVRQPFCSQLEECLMLWLEYHPQVASYARGDIGPKFALPHEGRPPVQSAHPAENNNPEYRATMGGQGENRLECG